LVVFFLGLEFDTDIEWHTIPAGDIMRADIYIVFGTTGSKSADKEANRGM